MLAFFLKGKRSRLIDQVKESTKSFNHKLYFVFGNEACDNDSALSSLIYAWFCSKTHKGNNVIDYIPVLNIKEDLYRLKTETRHMLQKYGVDKTDLVFRDTIDFEKFLARKPANVSITLVDHHILQRSDECFLPFIREIIDHRPQLQTFDGQKVSVDIAPVGSCMTLIAERVLQAINAEKVGLPPIELKELSMLMSGPILLDTVNLAEAAGKVTPRDREVIKNLWKNANDPEITKLFEELSRAKFSVEGLSTMDLLLKDLKTVESSDLSVKVIFSTMHVRIQEFREDESSECDMLTLLQNGNAQLLVALFPKENDMSGRPYKPVVLYSNQFDLKTKVKLTLQNSGNPSFNLVGDEDDVDRETCSYLRMYNIKASRKQLLPAVQECIQ